MNETSARRRALVAVGFVLAAAGMTDVLAASNVDARGLPADLAAAVRDYDHAQVASDRKELERLLADDYVLVNSGGHVQDKASFVADSTAPGFRLEPFVVHDERVSVWHDGALTSGVADLSGTSDGAPFKATLRFVDVWRKRGARWQVIFTQATRVPIAAPSVAP